MDEAVPVCDCFESTVAPGCYLQLITANAFTKLVNAPGFAKAGFAMDVDGGKPEMRRIIFVEVLRMRSSVIGRVEERVYGRMDVFRMVGLV